jgi:outer membrane autotransporter protein
MQGHQNQLRGLSSGEEYLTNQNVWLKAFGGLATQDAINDVSGYKINSSGLAIGID